MCRTCLRTENPEENPRRLERRTDRLVPGKQKAAWKQPYISAGNGGTLATAGNLVFQGTADGRVVAYRADTGKPLWEHRANSGVMAGPVTYTVNGEQYVAFSVGVGRHHSFADRPIDQQRQGASRVAGDRFQTGRARGYCLRRKPHPSCRRPIRHSLQPPSN